jgi:transposase
MGEVSTIGVDIAKSVFQIHGIDADGAVVIRKRVGRARVLEFFADLPPDPRPGENAARSCRMKDLP